MDEAKLAEIEARANAATPGPWEPEHRGVVGNDVFIVEDCVTAGWMRARGEVTGDAMVAEGSM